MNMEYNKKYLYHVLQLSNIVKDHKLYIIAIILNNSMVVDKLKEYTNMGIKAVKH